MQLGKYLENNKASRLAVVAVNLQETRFGAAPERLKRMVAKMHPAIRVVAGTPAAGFTFGRVENVPAMFIFDKSGKEVFRKGVKRGPGAKSNISPEQLARIVNGLK